jgi:UPF0755 protein
MNKLTARIVALFFLIAVGFGAYEMYLRTPGVSAPERTITVLNGESLAQVSAQLKEAGVISSPALFSVAADLVGEAEKLHPGNFVFKQGMSISSVLATLRYVGKTEVSVTIPEGYDLSDIANRLVSSGVIANAEDFYAVTGKPTAPIIIAPELLKDYPFLVGAPNLEGYLFPDTYRFYAASAPRDVVTKMLDEFKTQTEKLDLTRDQLILASIIEKEVAGADDRALVADIFLRRLKQGMPLQADSTVNYAVEKSTLQLTNDDLAVSSPYNTYKNAGLPPGPISNPGMSAITAAQNPKANPFWYFLTTKDGVVIYSRTLDEQNTMREKYLK